MVASVVADRQKRGDLAVERPQGKRTAGGAYRRPTFVGIGGLRPEDGRYAKGAAGKQGVPVEERNVAIQETGMGLERPQSAGQPERTGRQRRGWPLMLQHLVFVAFEQGNTPLDRATEFPVEVSAGAEIGKKKHAGPDIPAIFETPPQGTLILDRVCCENGKAERLLHRHVVTMPGETRPNMTCMETARGQTGPFA